MSENNVLAVVAGKEITQADFDAFARTIPQEQQAYLQDPSARQYFVDQFVSIYLFAQLAEDEKLDQTEEFNKIMANARRDVLGQMAMQKLLTNIEVSDEEAKAYFEANKDNFNKPETVSAKHILMESEEEIKDVHTKIEAGEISFEDAAKEYSTCPSKEQGGNLGEFQRGQMVPEFETAAFASEIGKITEPIKTQFGYHLIKVEGKNEASAQSYEEVASAIKGQLVQQKQNQVYEEKVKELKEKYCK
ncbi:MAG: peptidylprolyl isomerase [Hespellia sp.]|nr:peptidylprolyl isomerase [Hespellia sp.]